MLSRLVWFPYPASQELCFMELSVMVSDWLNQISPSCRHGFRISCDASGVSYMAFCQMMFFPDAFGDVPFCLQYRDG